MLGFVNYYRCYVLGYSAIVRLMNDLLGKSIRFLLGCSIVHDFRDLHRFVQISRIKQDDVTV